MRFQVSAAIVAIALFNLGCEKPNDAVKKNDKSAASSHDHNDHGHAHDDGHSHEGDNADEHGDDHPEHGPNSGHIFKFDTAGTVGEWKHFPGNDIIKVWLLDDKHQPLVMKVDSFQVIPDAGNDQTPFELEAFEADAEGKSAVYSLDDKNLRIAIPSGVTIVVKAGDKTMTGKIAAHEPMDH